ncbi:MAG: hypothetical protein SLAVMIC_00054 [uncultured marine phage]|uniref:Uncharacterized protein n=1 Tax=uncultured marine phage TaxID=707152 RepID=A0A8D9CAZ2_9VIRU|nr:MAG: hypothetical protein SLAVMIC_00054 [uncultured marine phage]
MKYLLIKYSDPKKGPSEFYYNNTYTMLDSYPTIESLPYDVMRDMYIKDIKRSKTKHYIPLSKRLKMSKRSLLTHGWLDIRTETETLVILNVVDPVDNFSTEKNPLGGKWLEGLRKNLFPDLVRDKRIEHLISKII